MSRNFKNNSAPKPMQKFCKVCQDAGKSESEYRSHFTRETRDPNSKVTCPTLLALECRYCYKNGHTVKYCPILKDNEKQQKREQFSDRRIETSTKIKPKAKKAPTNVFACLDSDSDEEEQKVNKKSVTKVEVKEDFPVLCAPSARMPVVTSNYASALTAPAPKAVTIAPKVVLPGIGAEEPNPAETTTKIAPWATRSTVKKASTMNWAAWDSESEDDEEEEQAHCCWDNQTVEIPDLYDDDTW
jgi:hypothetical protein